MIRRIAGELVDVERGRVALECEPLVYELLVPAVDTQRLSTLVGRRVTFHTLHYLEGQGQGTSFIPRLIGFQSAQDRAFFELFTTVKGMGNRKALRALERPLDEVALAIAEKDIDTLVTLPEIGKRTAETIVAELGGKVDRFIEVKGAPSRSGAAVDDRTAALAADAVAVLVQLGEQKAQARQLVDRVLSTDPAMASADQIVAAAFRLKELPA